MKRYKLSLTFLVFALFFINSCAGKNFATPEQGSLKLGITTIDEAKRKLGRPAGEGTDIINDVKVKIIGYAYVPTPATGKRLTLFFLENLLVGYEFVSRFKEDSTFFDPSKVSEIQKGLTTKEEVIKIFGNNYGQYIYPLITEKKQTALVYISFDSKHHAFADTEFFHKKLIITINNKNIVTDAKFVEMKVER